MLLGTIIALGTSSLWLVAWLVSLAIAVSIRKRIVLDRALLIVLLSVISSMIWSPSWTYAIGWLGIVFTLWTAKDSLRKTKFYWIPILIVSLIHVGIATDEYMSFVERWGRLNAASRVTGLASNASVMGLAGLSMFPIGSVVIGMSLSRTALVASAILTFLTPSRIHFAAFAVALAMSLWLGNQTQPDRYRLSGIERSIENRIALIRGTSSEKVPTRIIPVTPVPTTPVPTPPVSVTPISTTPVPTIVLVNPSTTPRRFRIAGTGLGNYVSATGKPLPHNIFVLAFWELGIFCVPFWIGLALLWWKYSRSYRLLIIVCTVGFVTPEFLARIEGVYMIVGLHTFCTRSGSDKTVKV